MIKIKKLKCLVISGTYPNHSIIEDLGNADIYLYEGTDRTPVSRQIFNDITTADFSAITSKFNVGDNLFTSCTCTGTYRPMNDAIDYIRSRFPIMQSKNFSNYSPGNSYKLLLFDEVSGYYAIGNNVPTNYDTIYNNNAVVTGYTLYDNNNNIITSGSYLLSTFVNIGSMNCYQCSFDANGNIDNRSAAYFHLEMIQGQFPKCSAEYKTFNLTNEIISWLNSVHSTDPIPEFYDPYTPGGISEGEIGGGGDFDDNSDPIDFPALPTIGAVDSGFITIFNPTLAEVKSLATYMWTNPLFDITTWKKIFADPMDAILGLSLIPVSIPDGGARAIKVGNIATDVTMNVAAAQFIEIQCGSINVNEYWGAYLDYSPYTKVEIYLPYCGTHQLSIDDVMNKTVEVRYHVDILSGACCAYVKCGDSVLYTFLGQCSSSIPVAANDFTNVINGVLSAAVSIGSMVATGGLTAPLAVTQLASTAVNSMKENVEKSGAVSGTGGLLAIQKPYIILTRPRQALPANQNQYTGYPSFITSSLGDLSGYTEIEQIHLHDIPATGEEIAEIEKLLKTGVIL